MEPQSVAMHRFSIHETTRIKERASAQGVTINSLLLWALSEAARPELERETGRQEIWLIPVNMREHSALDTSNHSSFVEARTQAGLTPAQVHAGIKAKLASQSHWGMWALLNSGKLVGVRGVRKIYQNVHHMGRGWVGTLSNLGDWHGTGSEPWYFCPPVSSSMPLGAGVVTCDGALSLTLQAHASVAGDPAWARKLMTAWVACLTA